jgi:hypothetical protein
LAINNNPLNKYWLGSFFPVKSYSTVVGYYINIQTNKNKKRTKTNKITKTNPAVYGNCVIKDKYKLQKLLYTKSSIS